MNDEELKRLHTLVATISDDHEAVILLVKRGMDVTVGTYGGTNSLTRLKWWAYKWLGGDAR